MTPALRWARNTWPTWTTWTCTAAVSPLSFLYTALPQRARTEFKEKNFINQRKDSKRTAHHGLLVSCLSDSSPRLNQAGARVATAGLWKSRHAQKPRRHIVGSIKHRVSSVWRQSFRVSLWRPCLRGLQGKNGKRLWSSFNEQISSHLRVHSR